MTGIISGSGLGLFNTSLGITGSSGNALLGRSGERVYLNSATGNLVIQAQDEYTAGLGLDAALLRTYNSQGQFTDDNGDNWRLNIAQLSVLPASPNTAGSTVTKRFGDGAEIVYTYDSTQGRYVSTAGEGAYDTLAYNATAQQWTWTDGDSQTSETYNSTGQLTATRDTDGNTLSYGYTGSLLSQITDASGQITYLDYAGTNLTDIRVVSQGQTQTRTRYAYDTSNRLTQVIVDLSPADNAIADGKTYVTTYTYDGTSKRVASITQGDGTSVGFGYTQINGSWRVTSMADGLNATTTYSYTDSGSTSNNSAPLIAGTTSTTDTQSNSVPLIAGTTSTTQSNSANLIAGTTSTTQSNNANLITSATTTPVVGWSSTAATLRESLTTAATNPQVTYDQNGNGMAIWVVGTGLYASTYSKNNDSWSTAITLGGTLTGTPSAANLSMSPVGNALVTWIQNNNVYAKRCINGVWDSSPQLIQTGSSTIPVYNPVGSINDSGRAIVAFLQKSTASGTPVNLFANVYSGTAWQSASTNLDDKGTANNNSITATIVPSVAMDAQNNATVTWLQKTGTQTADSLSFVRYNGSTWTNPDNTTLENTTTAVTADKIAFDGNGNGIVTWVQGTNLYAKTYTKSSNTWSAATTLSTTAAGTPSLSVSSNGNGLVTWVQSNHIYARRYAAGAWIGTAAELIDGQPTRTALDAVGSINNSGKAVIAFLQTDGTNYNVYANRYPGTGTSWAGAITIESNANSMGTTAADTPSVTIDASGNINALWLQKNGSATYNSVYSNHYNTSTTPYYTIPLSPTPTWANIAQALYGTNNANAAAALATAMGNPTLIAGNRLTGMPATLNYNTTVAAYYTVTATDTWTTITQTLYGTSNAAAVTALRTALNNPTLSTGLKLTVPATLNYTTTVAAYYTVTATDTWTTITQTLYGTSNAAAVTALRTALNNPTLSTGLKLTVPATLNYTTSVTVAPYYTVLTNDTWATITQTLYGTSEALAVSALQAALGYTGQPVPAIGTRLMAPSTLNFNRTVYTTTQTDITDPLGQITSYLEDAQGRLTRTLSPTVGGVRLQTDYAYDAAGNVTQITDGNGNVTTLLYDTQGNLTTRRDAVGNTITRTYSATNQLLTETRYLTPDPDAAGAGQSPANPLTTRYVYDSENHLRFIVSAEGRVSEHRYDTPGNRIATISYTAGTYSVAGLNPTDTLSESQLTTWVGTQPLTNTERADYAYDFRGNVSSVTAYTTVNASGVGVSDGTQSVTRFVYDQRGQLLKSIDARGEATASDPNDYVTTYNYDGLGRLLTTTQWVSGTQSRTTLNAYDDANRRTTTTLANGLATTSVYDKRGLLVSVSQANGALALGTTTYQYDADGQLRLSTDPLGNKTYLLYDEAGRAVATIDATGALTENLYDKVGNLVKQIRYAAYLTAAQIASLVDAQGNPATVTLASVRPALDSTKDRVARNLYDNANRLVMVIETTDTDAAQGYVTQNFYDGAGRITDSVGYANAITLPAMPTTTNVSALLIASSNDRHSRSFYDADNKLLATLDAEGYLSESKYNAAGELTNIIVYATATTTSLRASGTLAQLRPASTAQDQKSYLFYNGKGQAIATLDAEGYLTEVAYDLAGKPTQTTRYANKANAYTGTQTVGQLRPAVNANDQVVINVYDGANQLTQVTTNPNGTITRYTYDNVGNLVRTDKAWNTTEVRTTQARYDVQGHVLQELTGEGSVALGNLLATNPNATQAQIDALWAQYSLTHTYDQVGRRTSTTDQNNNKTLFYYDELGRLNYTVNALGEVAEIRYNRFGEIKGTVRYALRLATTGLTGGAITSAFAAGIAAIDSTADSHTSAGHTLRGAVKSATDALGNDTLYTYNAFGELTTRLDPIDTGSTTLSAFTYDHLGRLTQQIEDADNGDYAGLKRTTTRTYDAFGRVVAATDGNNNSTTFTYDRLGRQVTTTDPTGTRSQSYDAFSRTLTQTDARGNSTTINYNDAARSITVTTPEGITTTTASNRHGQSISVVDDAGNTTTYTYDKNGNIKSVTDASGSLDLTTSYDYDRANLTIRTTDANGVVTQVTYDAANRLLTRSVDPAGLNLTTSYGYDAMGRTVTVTDANGILTRTTYNAKGEVIETIVDPAGVNLHTRYVYDERGKVLTVTQGINTSAARTMQYSYDNLGRRIQEIVDPAGAMPFSTRYVYDANDNVVAKTEGYGVTAQPRSTRYVYDADNRLIYSVDAAGDVTKSDYDGNGNIIATTHYANAISLAGLGDAITATTIQSRLTADVTRDQVTRYAYDNDNRLIFTVDALQDLSERQYDNAGQLVRQTRYANALPTNVAITVSAIRAQLTGLAGAADEATRTIYDAAGRAVYAIDALNYVTQSFYDGNGNVIRSTQYANAITVPASPTLANIAGAITASANDRSERTVYDAANRMAYTIDAAGYVKETRYDDAGNIVETIAYANIPSLGQTTTTAQMQTALNAVLDSARDQHAYYQYDDAGRLAQSTDALGNTEFYTYDALGNKLSFTNKKGDTWTYAYDKLGHLLTETTPQVAVTRLTQNSNGTITPVTTQESIVTAMTYDAFGNVKTRIEAYGAPEARITTYVYDALGRQIQTLNPQTNVYNSNADQANSYVGRNEAAVIPTSTTYYDALGNAVANKDVKGNFSYKIYDNLGRVKYEIDVERYVTAYTYDRFGNQLSLTRYASALSESLFAGREQAASLQGFTVSEMAANTATIQGTQDRTITNVYDQRNLQAETRQPQIYNYDSNAGSGQTYFTASPTTRNTYNAFGQLIKQSTLKNPGADNTVGTGDDQWLDNYFYYDAKGQKTAEVNALGYVTTYQYDAEGSLVQQTEYVQALTAGSWNTAAYSTPTATLPANAASTSPIGFDRTTQYTYDVLNRKLTESKVNVQYSSATYGATTSITAQIGNLTTSYAYDALGNLTAITDATGATTYTYFDAMGRIVAASEPGRYVEGAGSANLPPISLVGNTLSWDISPVAGTIVTLKYRAVGSATGSTYQYQASTAGGSIIINNGRYRVDLSGKPSDVYEYDLTYTRLGDSAAYAEGTGTFNITGGVSAGSRNVAEVKPSVNVISTASADWTTVDWWSGTDAEGTPYKGYDESGNAGIGWYDYGWSGANRANLSWPSLAAWGSGDVQVTIDYVARDSAGNPYNTTRTQTFASGASITGAEVSWSNEGLNSITRIRVSKAVANSQVLLIDTQSSMAGAERLILSGNTTGLTAINIAGVGNRSVTALGAGIYAVDVSNLARGTYAYTPVGTSSSVGGSFVVLNSLVAGNPVVQELPPPVNDATKTWKLSLANLPANAQSVTLEYRPLGSSDPYVMAATPAAAGSGSFTVPYNDIPSGAYGYRLTVRDAQGNPINLSSVGGNSQGQITGSITILRGGATLPQMVSTGGSVLIPLTTMQRDVFGNAVRQTALAKGAASVTGTNFIAAAADPVHDQTTYGLYDNYGHVIRAVDAEGISIYSSYDAAGNIAKQWHTLTNADGQFQQEATLYGYDRVSHQIATTTVATTIFATLSASNTFSPSIVSTSSQSYGVVDWWTGSDESNNSYKAYDGDGNAIIGWYDYGWSGTSSINLSWSSLAPWGNGDVKITVDYVGRNASGSTYSNSRTQTFSSATSLTGVNFSWDGEGLVSVSRYRIWKKISTQQVEIFDSAGAVAPLPALTAKQVHYNAFGEIDKKGLNGAWQEYANYDNAGRLWQTNQGSGVNKVMFYDLQGNATASIQSATLDLHSFSAPWQISGSVQRTDTVYDVLGRTVQQMQPVFTTMSASNAFPSATMTVAAFSPSIASMSSQSYGVVNSWTDESGTNYEYGWSGTSSVNLTWSSLAPWGNGDVQVTVDYVGSDASGNIYSTSRIQTFSSASSLTGVNVNWGEEGLVSVSRYRIRKTIGTEQVELYDSAGIDAVSYRRVLSWQIAPMAGAQVALIYQPVGGGSQNTLRTGNGTIKANDSTYVVDLANFANGVSYTYQLTYNSLGESVPYQTGAGTGTFASTASVPAYYTIPSGATWVSIANSLYGTANVATQLQSALGNPPLFVGNRLANLPGTLAYTTTNTTNYGLNSAPLSTTTTTYQVVDWWTGYDGSNNPYKAYDESGNSIIGWYEYGYVTTTVPPYYIIPGGATWASIAGTLYGTANVAAQLQSALGNPPLTSGNWLTNLPGTLSIITSTTTNYAINSGALSTTDPVNWQAVVGAPATVTTTLTPKVAQTLDRWGNVLSTSDPRNSAWLTNYRYDYFNHVLSQAAPLTDIWLATGINAPARPTTTTYYDAHGLVIATIDPNGNVNGNKYDEAGQLVAEYHADGGIVKHTHDALGREVSSADGNGNITTYVYDRKDQLLKQQLTIEANTYTYDEDGHRITSTNGAGETTRFFYDSLGNVEMTRLPLGGTNVNTPYYITDTYDLLGRKISEGNGNGDVQSWSYNYFGKLQSHTDLGGHVTTTNMYDYAGQLMAQTTTGTGQSLSYTYYENGQIKRITDNTLHTETYYEYDAAGNQTRSRFASLTNGTIYQDSSLTYDALGRLTDVSDSRFHMQYYYDANGNRRRTYAQYYDSSNAQKTQDYWYTFDVMNRILKAQGVFVPQSGQIVVNTTQGTELTYDAAGNRRSAHFYQDGAWIDEGYHYDAENRLIETNRGGQLTSTRSYDAAGRVYEYISYSSPGVMKDKQTSIYNGNGWLLRQDSYNGSNQLIQQTRYYDNANDPIGNYDAVGNVLKYTLQVFQGSGYTNTYTKTYAKYDSYKEATVVGTSSYFQGGTTTETYDANGNLASVSDSGNSANNRTFINNAQGLVLQKLQNGKTEYYYYANNNPVGSAGDVGGVNASFDYNYTPVSAQYPSNTPTSYVFSQGDTLQSIALAVYGDAALWYLIADANGVKSASELRYGQTLVIPNKITNLHNSSMTHKVYAPGEIIGDTTPTLPDPPPPPPPSHKGGCGGIGMIVMIIVVIVASIFTAGAAALAFAGTLGSTMATAGLAGVMTAGMGTIVAAGGVAAGLAAAAIGGAVGSIVGQGIMMAAGYQDKFSWSAVGKGALTSMVSAGVAKGLDSAGVLQTATQGATLTTGQLMYNAAVTSVANQGTMMLLGQQKKFDWKSVAVAAVAAPIATAIDGAFKTGASANPLGEAFSWDRYGRQVASEALKGLTHQILNIAVNKGGKIQWAQVAGDAFGNAIANSVVENQKYTDTKDLTSVGKAAYLKSINERKSHFDALDEARGAQLDAAWNRAEPNGPLLPIEPGTNNISLSNATEQRVRSGQTRLDFTDNVDGGYVDGQQYARNDKFGGLEINLPVTSDGKPIDVIISPPPRRATLDVNGTALEDGMDSFNRLLSNSLEKNPANLKYLPAGSVFQSALDPTLNDKSLYLDYVSIRMRGLTIAPEEFVNQFLKGPNEYIDTQAQRDRSYLDRFNSFAEFKLAPYPRDAQGNVTVGQRYNIDIIGPDNGSVMLTMKEPLRWQFSVIDNSDASGQPNGQHPLSGNREFGWIDHGNGEWEFYTRGASKMPNSYNRLGDSMLSSTVFTEGGAKNAGWMRLMNAIADKNIGTVVNKQVTSYVYDPSKGGKLIPQVVNKKF